MISENLHTWTLSRQDTAILKGIAIIAMLCHHLFACPPHGIPQYDGLLGVLGALGKVCVSIFLFCSGYGLSNGYSTMCDGLMSDVSPRGRIKETLKFLAKRFVKFYAVYWPIFLIFVPISVLFFNRGVSMAYGDDNVLKCLLYDVLGIGGWKSYNITWWFNRLIIVFYLLFPLIYIGCRYVPWLILPISVCVMLFDYKLPAIGEYDLIFWQCPFVLGVLWHRWQDNLVRVHQILSKYSVFTLLILFFILCILCYCRIKHVMNPIVHYDFSGLYVDPFITLIIVTIISIAPKIPVLTSTFTFLGKHSGNTYMIHTFFFSYWFANFFYSCELGGG